MIRERRNKEKLQQYYYKFINEGILDPNVHPWVAESWKRCSKWGTRHDYMPLLIKLRSDELARRRNYHSEAIEFVDGLYAESREHFNSYNLSLLLIDKDAFVLKNYALPFYQKTPGDVEGARVAEQDIGTSSISLALEHKVPFLLFGPEIWIEDCQSGDACSAPIIINGEVKYILSLVAVQQAELPYSAIVSLLLSMKYGLEHYLNLKNRLDAAHTILDVMPLAVFNIKQGGEVAYANKIGRQRIPSEGKSPKGLPNINDVVLNYKHTALYKGFKGVPSFSKEVTWITPGKTYEDLTTVVPMHNGKSVSGIVAVSLPVEDLRTLLAYASGYKSRYSLKSMVGTAKVFEQMKNKATRAARSEHHLLLQGEPGVGKLRLAHGIHQASVRAAGPLISVKCAAASEEVLERELFGIQRAGEFQPGKIELANGGTLFLDEIEKMPLRLAQKLAEGLLLEQAGEGRFNNLDVRIIAACDSNLKRLADKGLFSLKLYELLSKMVIKIPSLRNRKEDIAVLANHIISEIAHQHDIAGKTLTVEAVKMLESFNWPGNIKQLQEVVELAFFSTDNERITEKDIKLPDEIGPSRAWKQDRQAFIAAWKASGGNISRLANNLSVSRVTLYRYLKKYGLEKE